MTTTDLARSVYDAYARVQNGGSPDECRATLGTLRAEYGDAAFDAAKVRALVSLQRANGGI